MFLRREKPLDVVTGKPLSDIFRLEHTLHFFQPQRDHFNKICVSSGLFSLTAWLEERRKQVLDLHEDLLCLVPNFGSYSPKGRKAAMSCSAAGQWNKGWTPIY